LCVIPDDEFTTCCFKWSNYYQDPTPTILCGKRVNVGENGLIAYDDVVVKEPCLDMNWRHLRNIVKPVVDEASGKLAMDGNRRTSPMRLDLGTLLVDTRALCVDERLYYEMDKTYDDADLHRCKK
jgi:hypothetical protein